MVNLLTPFLLNGLYMSTGLEKGVKNKKFLLIRTCVKSQTEGLIGTMTQYRQ